MCRLGDSREGQFPLRASPYLLPPKVLESVGRQLGAYSAASKAG